MPVTYLRYVNQVDPAAEDYAQGEVTDFYGLTVAKGDTYMGDGDTAYYAVVFNEDTLKFDQVANGYYPPTCEVDAGPEIMGMWEAKAEAARLRAQAARVERDAEQRYFDALVPRRGKTVKVVKGRKVPVGTVGEVMVRTEGQWGWRVLLKTADGTEYWTAQTNVEVVLQPAIELVAAG